MEHHEDIRPTNSDEEVVAGFSFNGRYNEEALVKATHSIETSSSVLGEEAKEEVPWRLMVWLEKPSVSFSLEKELLIFRGGS